jgi:hypothetical protein
LQQLATIRSSLALDIQAYYNSVVREMNRTPWRRSGAPVLASDIAIQVRVVKKAGHVRRISRGEHERDDERERGKFRSDVDPETAALYELPTTEDPEIVEWTQERELLTKAMILGGPGGGKTFLTQTTAFDLAKRGLDEWARQSRSLEQLPLLVCLPLEDVARADLPASLAEALLFLLRGRQFAVSAVLDGWLRRGFARPECWLILDALNQLGERAGLKPRLLSIDHLQWKCKVILTCRTASYSSGEFPWDREITMRWRPRMRERSAG